MLTARFLHDSSEISSWQYAKGIVLESSMKLMELVVVPLCLFWKMLWLMIRDFELAIRYFELAIATLNSWFTTLNLRLNTWFATLNLASQLWTCDHDLKLAIRVFELAIRTFELVIAILNLRLNTQFATSNLQSWLNWRSRLKTHDMRLWTCDSRLWTCDRDFEHAIATLNLRSRLQLAIRDNNRVLLYQNIAGSY